MEKGRQYRRSIPYTASGNWGGSETPAARIFLDCEFSYNGAFLFLPFTKSNLCTNPISILTQQWQLAALVGTQVFVFTLLCAPLLHQPENLIQLDISDLGGASLIQQWHVDVGQTGWSTVMQSLFDFTPTTRIAIPPFDDVEPDIQFGGVHYHDE